MATAAGRPARLAGATSGEWTRPNDNGFRQSGLALLLGVLGSLPILAFGGWLTYNAHAEIAAIELAVRERLLAYETLIAAAPKEMLELDRVLHGKQLFDTSCIVCHSPDGTGVAGLGKDITQSWFVASMDDEQLAHFVAVGREANDPLNSTQLPMPAMGGRDDLTETDLADIVMYMRGLQDPRRMPELPASAFIAPAVAAPTEDEKSQALAAAGGDEELAGWIASGSKLFATACIACHGKAGTGVKGNGKALAANEFVNGLDDDSLLEFLLRGRDPSDPANTTGISMPPKGGNPALSEDDLLDIITYLRTLPGNTFPPEGES